jgi:hypothetical protein
LRPGPVRSQSPFGVEALGLLSPASPPKCAAFVLPCAAGSRLALPSALGFVFLGSCLLFSVLSRSAPSPASCLPRAPSFSVFRFSPSRARVGRLKLSPASAPLIVAVFLPLVLGFCTHRRSGLRSSQPLLLFLASGFSLLQQFFESASLIFLLISLLEPLCALRLKP